VDKENSLSLASRKRQESTASRRFWGT